MPGKTSPQQPTYRACNHDECHTQLSGRFLDHKERHENGAYEVPNACYPGTASPVYNEETCGARQHSRSGAHQGRKGQSVRYLVEAATLSLCPG